MPVTPSVHSHEKFKTVASVYLVLHRDEQVLLLRRANTGYEDGNYGLPAGHVEAQESLRQAMAREAKEEVGLGLDPDKLYLAHTMHRWSPVSDEPERLDFFLTILEWKGEPANCETEK